MSSLIRGGMTRRHAIRLIWPVIAVFVQRGAGQGGNPLPAQRRYRYGLVPRNSGLLEVPGWQERRSGSGGLVARPEIHRDTVTCQ
jgi:hypothetical protein